MKRLALILIALAIFGCENGPLSPKGGTNDTINPPPPVVRDSVPIVDSIPDPPPPVDRDSIAPPPPVEEKEEEKEEEKPTSYTLALNYYEITEGRVSDEQALKNRYGLERAMQDAKSVGIDTFKIGKVDIYFDVTTITSTTNPNFYPFVEGINLPSDFHLIMSDDTYLRVQPNNSEKYSLLVMLYEKNVSITGGNLIGERLEHTWSGKRSDEWGHLINISSSQNVVIDNVNTMHANGDGLVVHTREFTFRDNYVPSKDILIKNSRFIGHRRQGISITCTEGTIVDNCFFDRIGANMPGSDGTNPRFAIDVEAYRERDKKTNEVIHYERTENVIIRNNKEINGARGGFIFKSGDNMLIENNELESGIVIDHTSNVIARGNRVINPYEGRVGIRIGTTSEFSKNNTAVDNYIEGCAQGILVGGDSSVVKDNVIRAFNSGIVIKDAKNSLITGNDVQSDVSKSTGLFMHVTYADGLKIEDNTFKGDRSAAQFTYINMPTSRKGYSFEINNNVFEKDGPISLDRVNGAKFGQNTVKNRFQIKTANNIALTGNQIDGGIQLREGNGTISIMGNTMTGKGDCIEVLEEPQELTVEGNGCQ